MDFQYIPKIDTSDFYIDLAFSRAKAKADLERQKLSGTRLDRSRTIEITKIDVVKDQLNGFLLDILKKFPSIDVLPKFYLELIKCVLDYAKLKKSLGSLNWAATTIARLHRDYTEKIKRCRDMQKIVDYKQEFFGRISSVMRQIKKNLEYLENSRKTLRGFPVIKDGFFTVAISGFPNVGKTTLLYKLTGSKPEISNYAFTTKGINVAYASIENQEVQFLDVPGTLNREEKMNYVEKQADLALKMLANLIIYVFDPSESSYPIADQEKLYKDVKKGEVPVICYAGKKDISQKEAFGSIVKKYGCITEPGKLKGTVAGFLKKTTK